jgi:hypothetical protein
MNIAYNFNLYIKGAMKVDKESEFDTCVQLTEEWNREVAALRYSQTCI